jgi:hypothetical protein
MKKVSLILYDSRGFVVDEYNVTLINKTQLVSLVIDDHEYYVRDNGELTLRSQPHDVFVVMYENPLVGYKGNMVTYCLRARDDREAMRQALLNTDFQNKINMANFDKKYLTAYKPKIYKVDEIGKINYYEGDPRL